MRGRALICKAFCIGGDGDGGVRRCFPLALVRLVRRIGVSSAFIYTPLYEVMTLI